MQSAPHPRRLYRSRENRMIAGVCAGVAEYFGWDPTVVRLVAVISVLFPGPQVLAYLLAWLVIPEAPSYGAGPGAHAEQRTATPDERA